MSLVNPSALLLAGLAIPILALYILKVRLRRAPVSTLLFWRQIFEEKKPRSLWQRLRHLISLLLQLAFLALLVLALADPIFRWQQAQARKLVMVVDNSASMKAGDVPPNRFEAARSEGLRIIDGMRLGDELAIITGGVQPQVVCGMTGHQRTLRSALESIRPVDGPTRVTEAVALARRLLDEPSRSRKVIVLSDGSFDGAADLGKQEDVELIAVGKKSANLGITRLQARRSLLDPLGYEILVEVANASDDPAECRLELDLDDEPIDVVPLKLKPGENSTQIFEKTSSEGGLLRARLDRTDALATDNTAVAAPPPPQPPAGAAGDRRQPVPGEGLRGHAPGRPRGRQAAGPGCEGGGPCADGAAPDRARGPARRGRCWSSSPTGLARSGRSARSSRTRWWRSRTATRPS